MNEKSQLKGRGKKKLEKLRTQMCKLLFQLLRQVENGREVRRP